MGNLSSEGRLQNPIPENPTQIPSPHPSLFISPRVGTVSCPRRPHLRDAGEVSHRSSYRQVQGLLLPDVCSPQVVRRLETNHRPQPPECVYPEISIQNGNSSIHQAGITTQRLAHVNRSQRCVFPHRDPPLVQALPKIRLGPDYLPVQSDVFRVKHGTLCIHPSIQTDINPSTPGGLQTLPVSGRLVTGSRNSTSSVQGNQLRPDEMRTTRLDSEFQEIRFDANTVHSFPRNATGYSPVHSQALGRPYTEVLRRSQILLSQRSSNSDTVSQTDGTHVFIRKDDPARPPENQTAAIPPIPTLEHRDGHGDQDPHLAGGIGSSTLVAEPDQLNSRSKDTSGPTRSLTVHRCLQCRLGSTCRGPESPRPVDPNRESLAYQLLRTGSTLERTPNLSDSPLQLECSRNDGQHDSSWPDPEPRRHQITPPDETNRRNPPVGTAKENNPSSQTCSGYTKRSSRQAQPERSTSARRVVSQSKYVQETLENLEQTRNRPLCSTGKYETPTLLQPSQRRSGSRTRRTIPTLGRKGSLCLSSHPTSPNSPGEIRSINQNKDDTNRTEVAKPDLVPSTTRTTDRRAKRPRQHKNTPKTAEQVPPTSRSSQPSRLALIIRGYRKAGFSRDAATRMSQSTRRSTNRVYQSKWQRFANWCSQRKKDPRKTNIPIIADFLIHLRAEKKFSIPTIKGYRSALSLVLKAKQVDLKNSLELTALIRSMAAEIPPRQITTPKWNLTLVLETLLTAPYEPLEEASLKFLTHKCSFLIALASAKRVSKLQALTGQVAHKEDWSVVSFDFARDFLAKTEVPTSTRYRTRSFQIPSLGNHSSEHNDQLLCPVRALRIYYRRTAERRTAESRLFIPVLGQRSSVSKNTISAWITSVVRRAYQHKHQDLHELHRITAHEVRALATSWNFHHNLSLESVMEAASWRTHSTFSSFYLRDVTFMADGLLKLGPIVAAQQAL